MKFKHLFIGFALGVCYMMLVDLAVDYYMDNHQKDNCKWHTEKINWNFTPEMLEGEWAITPTPVPITTEEFEKINIENIKKDIDAQFEKTLKDSEKETEKQIRDTDLEFNKKLKYLRDTASPSREEKENG